MQLSLVVLAPLTLWFSGGLAPQASTSKAAVVHHNLESRAQPIPTRLRFVDQPGVDQPGVQVRSGRLIVRPLQRSAYRMRGRTIEEALSSQAQARRLLRSYERIEYVAATDETILRVPQGMSEEMLAESLLASGLFEYAEPDWLVSLAAQPQTTATQRGLANPIEGQPLPNCPNDPYLTSQWYHGTQFLRSCAAWGLTTGEPSVVVGICDTGVDIGHSDLQLHRLEAYNAVDRLWESQGGQIYSIYNHGTGTTGVAAANGNNGVGMTGVGWNLGHRMLRVTNNFDGTAWLSDLQHAARTSIENGDRVANVSYEGVWSLSNATTARYVESLGGVLVWAAGNSNLQFTTPDRDSDDLIVVGATTSSDAKSAFSNYGQFVDLVAPGTGILTLSASGGYSSVDGTSFASPMVAGICAMLWSQRPNLTPKDLQAILKASCTDLGTPGVDSTFGYGRADLLAALMTSGLHAPVADFDAPVQQGIHPLTVHFRDLSTGIGTQWLWTFGDGSTSTQQNPAHTYTSTGAYSVSLTVTNSKGTDTKTEPNMVLVDVIPPIANFAADVTSGLSPLPVQFTSLTTGGLPTSWLWDFGDGSSSTAENPSHVYTTSGTYDVSLTAQNSYGSDTWTQSALIHVDTIPPFTNFHATPLTGNSPLQVSFTDDSTGVLPTAWTWYFGDGFASNDQNPVHTYTSAGNYTVRLVTANAFGNSQLQRNAYIQVGAGPPVLAQFTGTPTTGNAPLTVTFTDQSLGAVVTWLWEFDDGTTSTLRNPVHTYTSPGEYNVVLQVEDSNGNDNNLERRSYIIVQ